MNTRVKENTYLFIQWSLILSLSASVPLLSGCASANNTEKGGAIGAGAGGVVGTMIGAASGNTAVGAIVGAAVGGTAGALIGRRMDKQAEELQQDLQNATVERVGEGIRITFDSGLLFDVNSDNLQATTRADLGELTATLKKYDDTNILIEGHTDATGTEEYNQDLSERRADAVAGYLLQAGVGDERLATHGYGEDQPVADNETEAGRQQNRRVEVAIFASEQMVKTAEQGDLTVGG